MDLLAARIFVTIRMLSLLTAPTLFHLLVLSAFHYTFIYHYCCIQVSYFSCFGKSLFHIELTSTVYILYNFGEKNCSKC